MTLLQIHEPGQTPDPHADDQQVKRAVGIDLGTTHSLVASSADGKVQMMSDERGATLLPSAVALKDGNVVVGEEALSMVAQGKASVIRSIKRLMGRGREDIKSIAGTLPYEVDSENEGVIRVQFGEKKVTPIEISSWILGALKARAKRALAQDIDQAVITVPAYFDDAARTATKAAARLAGLEVLRLINEPTAAALAYGLDHKKEGTYGVYDLGGGTFDISILKMEKGVFQVVSTAGTTEIGGDDFDRAIVELLLWEYTHQSNKAPKLNVSELNQLLLQAKHVKEQLSDHDEIEFNATIAGVEVSKMISRAEFNQSVDSHINATLDVTKQALHDADLSTEQLDGVILVGGSTRVPAVKDAIKDYCECPIFDNIDPDLVVAQGAALQAEALTVGSDNLLLDVLPLSLSLETMGGLAEKVIHRNTPIPVAKAQEFTTYENGQTAMSIHVLQGERETVMENRSLAKFTLQNIPPLAAGVARIRVEFRVDVDGLLTVSATEQSTGQHQEVEVKPSYGLSEEEIQSMLYSAMEHGREDMQTRMLIEARVSGGRLIEAVNEAMQLDGELISEDERIAVNALIEALQNQIESEDREAIIAATKALEVGTSSLAENRMNKYISIALEGKNVDDVETKN